MTEVGVSWTIWDWGRSIYGYRSARDLAAAAEVGVRTAQRNVVLDVKLAYYAALAAENQVAVADDGVRTYDAHLAQTRGLHDAGLRTGIDVATAQIIWKKHFDYPPPARAGRPGDPLCPAGLTARASAFVSGVIDSTVPRGLRVKPDA